MEAHTKKEKRSYITGSKFSKLSKSIAQVIYPSMSRRDFGIFSAHMIHMIAAVLLQAADKPGHFIKSRLNWESNAYQFYLRDKLILTRQHNKSTALFKKCVGANNILAVNLAPATDVPPQLSLDKSGVYSEM